MKGASIYLVQMNGRRDKWDKKTWLSAIQGLFFVGIGLFMITVGISVLLSDLSNMFARVIMAAFGIQTTITIIVGVFFTAAGAYITALGVIVCIALLTRSPKLERIVFRKKGR